MFVIHMTVKKYTQKNIQRFLVSIVTHPLFFLSKEPYNHIFTFGFDNKRELKAKIIKKFSFILFQK